jgi:Cys-tRNA(Pro) deacylase
MSKERGPVTAAVRMLRENGVEFTEHSYKYAERGGTAEGARQLDLDEHLLVKTLVMEDELKRPVIVLMHGDQEVSTKELARLLGVKRVGPCTPETARKHSGYMVGGTSPFGIRKEIPVYVEETILSLPRIYINGGKRGYLLGIDPGVLGRVLKAVPVMVGIG